jgi:hypothetical protein
MQRSTWAEPHVLSGYLRNYGATLAARRRVTPTAQDLTGAVGIGCRCRVTLPSIHLRPAELHRSSLHRRFDR